jgi:hypothetical protein
VGKVRLRKGTASEQVAFSTATMDSEGSQMLLQLAWGHSPLSLS